MLNTIPAFPRCDFLIPPPAPAARPSRVMGAVRKEHLNGILWCALVFSAVVIFWFFSDGDFSFLMVR